MALENGLIDENGNPTEMANKRGPSSDGSWRKYSELTYKCVRRCDKLAQRLLYVTLIYNCLFINCSTFLSLSAYFFSFGNVDMAFLIIRSSFT